MHLATSLDEEVFKQLTAPNLVMVQKRGGFTSNEWRKSFQDRDEVLDCAVYARAAAYFRRGAGRRGVRPARQGRRPSGAEVRPVGNYNRP